MASSSGESKLKHRGSRTAPSYIGLKPASKHASAAARGSSKKQDTKPEVLLRKALWRAGLRYRKNVASLPGNPDLVFPKAKIVIFCDGDFWHGRNWEARKSRLQRGTNASYWVKKIERNMMRDAELNRKLTESGWVVVRFWETDISTRLGEITIEIIHLLSSRC